MSAAYTHEVLTQERESDREYLCQSFLHTLSLVSICVGWAWGVVLIAMRISLFSSLHWLSPLSLILSGVASYRWYERHRGWATASALCGVFLALAVAAYASSDSLFLFGLAFIIIVAGVLSQPPVIVIVTILSASYVLFMQRTWGGIGETTRATLLFVGGSLGLSWMLWHYIYVALELSWQSRQRAMQEMRNARQRRAELRRANKALDEGYDRLRRLNQELIEARREAESARRIKAEFAANVSHELRTPINLIIGFSEMMYAAPESYSGQVLPPEYMGDAHAIYRSARHLQTLIDDILDLSRIDAKRMALTREMFHLGDVIGEATRVIRDLVERKGLDLQVEIEPHLPQVYLDRTRIRQVLLNLISNAVRFTERGYVRVWCGIHSDGDTHESKTIDVGGSSSQTIALPNTRYIQVSVSDSGIGIRPEDIDKVFEEFRQVDGSPRRKYGGTGLGLAISKRFVELHAGWMWVESEFGSSSTFHFALPAAEESWVRPGFKSTGDSLAARPLEKAVIVIDDDPNVVRFFRRYMRNCRVEGAATLQEVTSLVTKLAPELLVIANDTRIEDVLAWQDTCPPLAEADLSVLACPIPSERRKALSLGLADYLVKPVSQEQLQGAMGQFGSIGHVLAVEDDPDMMRLLGRMLARMNTDIEFQRAYSAEEAQLFLRSRVTDLVLLDLALPGMSGYDLLIWLQQEASLKVPVIAITANAHLEASEPLDIMRMTLARRSGFSIHELLTFAEIVADEFPCHYLAVPNKVRETKLEL